ncbi:MAG: hypothetical protein O8C67_15255 [Candidatus Methanoperedens sp.]|nr:hypothetical protein [Candidatus Methanoperedens sp.]
MKFFYLLSNGEIVEDEAQCIFKTPTKFKGQDVVAACNQAFVDGRRAMENIKRIILSKKEGEI